MSSDPVIPSGSEGSAPASVIPSEREGSARSRARLALVFAGGPMLALMMQGLTMAGVPWACVTQNLPLLHILPAAFVVAALVLVGLAWSSWSRTGRSGEAAGANVDDRSRFLALSGLILSIASVVLIAWMWVPLFVFDPCVR